MLNTTKFYGRNSSPSCNVCVQPFLQWKHPVRIHTHKKAVHPPEEAWKYISEGFYDDYTDTRNSERNDMEILYMWLVQTIMSDLEMLGYPEKWQERFIHPGIVVSIDKYFRAVCII